MKVAINGFGRIGRSLVRAIYEQGLEKDIQLIHINSSPEIEISTHLLNFDSTNGRFIYQASFEKFDEKLSYLKIKEDKIKFTTSKDLSEIDWKEVDIVFECSGAFLSKEKAQIHLEKGAKKVILSAPAKSKDIKTIIYQVNEEILTKEDNIISIGSCTTNCLAPVIKVLDENFGITNGFATTIHAYTNDQNLLDNKHKDFRRARTANLSIIPTTSGVSSAIGEVFPHLKGKVNGSSMRVPVHNVSIVDFKFVSQKKVDIQSINKAFEDSRQKMNKVLDVSNLPLVSIDFIKTTHSSIVDSLETSISGENFARVCAWYDNEWSFVLRMIDVCLFLKKFN